MPGKDMVWKEQRMSSLLFIGREVLSRRRQFSEEGGKR